MKKIVTLLLCVVIVFSIVSCNEMDVDNEQPELLTDDQSELAADEPTDSMKKDTESLEEFSPLSFSGEYAHTLTLVCNMIDYTFQYNSLDMYLEKVTDELGFANQGKPSWFDNVVLAIFENSLLATENSHNYNLISKAMYAYFVKDINNDGIDELFLFCNEPFPDRLIAVFTKSHAETVLLDAYALNEIACFDSNGFLRVEFNHQPRFMTGCPGYSYPDSTAIYQLLPTGDRWTLLDHVGGFYDGNVDHYRMINGERIRITEEEYANFVHTYGNNNAFYDRFDIMCDAGLVYSYFYSFPTGK